MNKAKIEVTKLKLPTYPEPPAEIMPMFAENRVHQRTSGNPYPNRVVLDVDRSRKDDREYTLVVLENEYVKIEILPEIGGRIYSAYDKRTGYDYFYRQHVIKPALIGVLGSWVSGGVEFNWPFHHRASGYKPCDFKIEEMPDGSVACHLSEHDPIDRLKGMVSVILRPGETIFETRMRLYNRTPTEKSFLWWENAAVSVNENYKLFFPPDVTYVNFHYLKSRTSFPIAKTGTYNGIPMKDGVDISLHKNTRDATSYFAAASKYDFFGGYDYGKECGVVHIGDHRVTPGKKMFTWAYGQLSKSWERALTDEDGAYAELMAGSYSDNQPDFAWLAPYETKEFSQFWYPIEKIGAPDYADRFVAFRIDNKKGEIYLCATRKISSAQVLIKAEGFEFSQNIELSPEDITVLKTGALPENAEIIITAEDFTGRFRVEPHDRLNIPENAVDLPTPGELSDADSLYLAGIHAVQYRDPAIIPEKYFKEAISRNPSHAPSLLALAEDALSRYLFDRAEEYAARARDILCRHNAHPQSGRCFYLLGKIYEMKGELDRAIDNYAKAAWNADFASPAMTRMAVISLRTGEPRSAIKYAETALDYGRNNSLAAAALAVALMKTGDVSKADDIISDALSRDPHDRLSRALRRDENFYFDMGCDPAQVLTDVAFDMADMGLYREALDLLSGLEKARPECRVKPLYYAMGHLCSLLREDPKKYFSLAKDADLGSCYPSRYRELLALADAAKSGGDEPKMLAGCILYSKRRYKEAASLWQTCEDRISKRCLAAAYFSHLGREDDAKKIMLDLCEKFPSDEQLLCETAVLLDKMRTSPEEKIKLLSGKSFKRDDLFVELAKAYNQAFMPDEALKTLSSHDFVPCEGGEHAIAEQYMFACLTKGRTALQNHDLNSALSWFQKGQTLPENLGAGIWNRCFAVPLKYFEAVALSRMGENTAAREIYDYIISIETDYFSNMYLRELPFYRALSLRATGRENDALYCLTTALREWKTIEKKQDGGFFGTTPFFRVFTDDPKRLRTALYLYLSALCDGFAGNKAAAREKLSKSVSLNLDNLSALGFIRFGLPAEKEGAL